MDLKDFQFLMARRAANLPGNVNELKKRVAKDVIETVAQTTPVDKGTAVSNWQAGLGSSNAPVIEAHDPGSRGSTRSGNVHATIAAGTQVIDQALPGQEIHISNNVEYIKDLNEGSSSQAPAGFVETAVLVARQRIGSAKVVTDT